MASSLKFYSALLIWPTSGHLFYVLVMLLVGLLDVIDTLPESYSTVSNEICGLQGFVFPRSSPLLSEVRFVAAVFFSHPDESNIVAKIIATNVERSVVFTGLTQGDIHSAKG